MSGRELGVVTHLQQATGLSWRLNDIATHVETVLTAPNGEPYMRIDWEVFCHVQDMVSLASKVADSLGQRGIGNRAEWWRQKQARWKAERQQVEWLRQRATWESPILVWREEPNDAPEGRGR